MSTKIFFSLFSNDGEKAASNTFKKYKGKGPDGKSEFDEVTADYRITSLDGSVEGSAIKDRSQAGNPVVRVNFKANELWYKGTLNLSKNKKKETEPDMFGTASTKDDVEMDMACWIKLTKEGKKYLSCNLQEPYKKRVPDADQALAADDASTAQYAAEEDDIPF